MSRGARRKKRAKSKPRAEAETSGVMLITLPRGLHRRAAIAATRDGVDLTTWINCALAHYVGAAQAAMLLERR
jgi:predicted HicB family RNase H-like nuclease